MSKEAYMPVSWGKRITKLGEGFLRINLSTLAAVRYIRDERAALYGKTLEGLDYSPEIDTNLKVICFQTFVGHCGCILFNVDEMK